MNIVTAVRRAFAANPHKVPADDQEKATLEARGFQEPFLQTYLAWRRNLMIFVVLATLLSAGLATYRDLTESETRFEIMQKISEHFPLDGQIMPSAKGASDEAADAQEEQASEEAEEEPQTAFGQFTDIVQLVALYSLPLAALAVVVLWTRFHASFLIMVAAFGFSFLVPLLIALCPWNWWGYVEPAYNRQTQPLQFFGMMAEGLLEGIAYLVTLLPTVLSLVPGVQRACVRVKLLLPQSILPGWFLVVAAPFYALFLLVVFVAIDQFDTHPLFFVGMLLFLSAPLVYALKYDLLTQPLASEQGYRRICGVQRTVGIMTLLAAALMVTYLATREIAGVHLLGLDPKHALLLPLDVVEFLLETISRSMFITVLGADLFMQMNLKVWKNTRQFAGTPEAASYDRIMEEFQSIACR